MSAMIFIKSLTDVLDWSRFLALLDYVSRAHEIAICPSSVVRPSVRQSVLQLSLHGFLSNFSCVSPGQYARAFFDFFKRKHFFFSLTWDPMGAKISKRYFFYKSQPKVFNLFLNFLPNGPHNTMFGIFEILKIKILTNFIRFR